MLVNKLTSGKMDVLSGGQLDTLRVTPHEDEGYLSPSEEDIKNYSIRPSGFLNCRSWVENLGNRSKSVQECGDDSIEWERVALIPYIYSEHFSWDRLQLPVPYRFQDVHRSCLRQIRRAPSVSYLTDCANGKLPDVIENIWRSLDLERERGHVPALKQAVGCKAINKVDVGVAAIQAVKTSPVHISIKEFVQHVFHLLCGRESLSFQMSSDGKFRFTKNPLVLVHGMSPSLVANLALPFLKCGRIYKRLSYLSSLHYDEKLMEREGLKTNTVFIAFLKFIWDYLKLYQTSMMLKAPNVHSFSSLNIFFKPVYHQLETLELILNLYITSDQITLLKGLNSLMLCCEPPPFVADLLRSVFIACSAAYLRYVSDWIFRGALAKGFHIQKAQQCTYQDRRYWIKQFSQVTAVPTFLENNLGIIFETGKAINLLNLIRNTESNASLMSCILQDEGTNILPVVDFTEVASLQIEWKIKVDSFFEEYSFLQTDLEELLIRPEDSKNTTIDFDRIEEVKQSFEERRTEMRQRRFEEKAEKQRNLSDSLNQQIAAKREREKHEKEVDLKENKRISEYIAVTDQRDLDEEIRLMKKHFGEHIKETVGVRNVKQRMAFADNENLENTLPDIKEPEPNVVMDSSIVEILETNSANVSEDIDPTVEEQESASQSTALNIDSRRDDDVDGDNHLNGLESEGMDAYEPVTRRKSRCDNKFNPDNLKVRDPVPYNIELDLDTLGSDLLPRSIVKFDKGLNCSSSRGSASEESSLRHDSFFLNMFLSQSVAIPVGAQNRMVNSTLLHYFIVEKRLFQHIEALNSYLCLQNGLFGHFLTTLLIQEVKNGILVSKEDIPNKAGRLNEILGEAMVLSAEGSDKNDFRDNLGFILARESNGPTDSQSESQKPKSRSLTSKYEVLDDITLNYSVEWPLSIFITDDLLLNYEKLFMFLMRLYRSELLLLSLSSVLKFKGSNSKQLEILHHYRYKMLQFVRSVRHYVNVTVIHCAWTDLESSFHKMNSLDKIYEGLVRHIKFVTTNCLLGTKGEGVKKLLVDQLIVIECFCKGVEEYSEGVNFDLGEEMQSRQFARLRQKFKVWEEIQKVFIQVFFKLANKGIYQKVSYFLQLFNFNGYFEGSMAE